MQDLFIPGALTDNPDDAPAAAAAPGKARKGSAFKRAPGGKSETAGQLGPVMQLELHHQGDDEALTVSLRALQKVGSSTQFYVVVHVAEARCGKEGFLQWLLPPGGGGGHSTTAVAATSAMRKPLAAVGLELPPRSAMEAQVRGERFPLCFLHLRLNLGKN